MGCLFPALLFATSAAALLPGVSLVSRPHDLTRRAPVCWARTQVVTDIDDTIKSSGGVAIPLLDIPLGGVDTSYTRNSFYPGVFQFNLELARQGTRLGSDPLKIAVISARASEFLWALEIKQSSKLCTRFREAGKAMAYDDWGVGTVLYGSVQEWICQDRKGWRKFENFKILLSQRKESTKYIFIGDNGKSEQDFEAAKMIVDAYPGRLKAIFLHAVISGEQPAPLPEDTEYEGVPVIYYRTYVSAARKAAQRSLIGRGALLRIIEAIERDMAADPINIAPGSANELLLRSEIEEAGSDPEVADRIPVVGTLGRAVSGATDRLFRAVRGRISAAKKNQD